MESGSRKRSIEDEVAAQTCQSSLSKRPRESSGDDLAAIFGACDKITELLLRSHCLWRRSQVEKAEMRAKITELEAKIKSLEDLGGMPASGVAYSAPQLRDDEAMQLSENRGTAQVGYDDIDEEEGSSSILALLTNRSERVREGEAVSSRAESSEAASQELPQQHEAAGVGGEQQIPSSRPINAPAPVGASAKPDVIVLDSDDEDSPAVHPTPKVRPTHVPEEDVKRTISERYPAATLQSPHQAAPQQAPAEIPARASNAGAANEDGDEELIFVSASAQLGGDLPHPRSLCPTEKFHASEGGISEAARGEQNARMCRLCYCYVCDMEAKDCGRWRPADGGHCNAHGADDFWKHIRAVFKKGLLPISEVSRCLGVKEGYIRDEDCAYVVSIQKAFNAYHKGKDGVRYDPIRRRNVVAKVHTLVGLADIIHPISTTLRTPMDSRLFGADSKKQPPSSAVAPAMDRTELAGLICRLDAMLAAALSNTWRRNGNEADRSALAASEQYWALVKSITHFLAAAMLIAALEPSLQGFEGKPVLWSNLASSAVDRLERFKACLPPRSSEIRTTLDALTACISNGWSMLVLPGAQGAISAGVMMSANTSEGDAMRMVRLRALLASGVHSRHVLSFCSSEGNQGLLRSAEVQDLLLTDGMVEETCDAILLMAPTRGTYSDGFVSHRRFSEIMNKIWVHDTAAGVRFGLRAALLDVLPYKPDMDCFNPIAAGRCGILQNTITGLLLWAGNATVLQWQQDYCRRGPEYVPDGQGMSLAAMRSRAAQLWDSAGVFSDEDEDAGAHTKLAARARLKDVLHEAFPPLKKEDRHWVALFYIEAVIIAFSRINGRRRDKLCLEVSKMASLLASQGHAVGVASLTVCLKALGVGPGRMFKRRLQLLDVLLTTRFLNASSGWQEPLSLTLTLDQDSLLELTETDDLASLTPAQRQSLAQLCVRLTEEGATDTALHFAEALAASVPLIAHTAYLSGSALTTQLAGFWESVCKLAPVAQEAGKHQLAERCVWEAFRCKPCLEHMNALLATIKSLPADHIATRKDEARRMLIERAKTIPALDRFGGLARLGCPDSALDALDQALRRYKPAQVGVAVSELLQTMGREAVHPIGSSLFDRIVPAMQTGMRGRVLSPFESELVMLLVFEAAAKIDPAAVLSYLRVHVSSVCARYTDGDAHKKPSAEVKTALRQWVELVKTVCYTRPADEQQQQGQEREEGVVRFRVRGPSLADEWERILEELREKLQRRPSVWSVIKSACGL